MGKKRVWESENLGSGGLPGIGLAIAITIPVNLENVYFAIRRRELGAYKALVYNDLWEHFFISFSTIIIISLWYTTAYKYTYKSLHIIDLQYMIVSLFISTTYIIIIQLSCHIDTIPTTRSFWQTYKYIHIIDLWDIESLWHACILCIIILRWL